MRNLLKFPFRLPVDLSKLSDMSFRNGGLLLRNIVLKLWISVGGRQTPTIVRATSVIVKKLVAIKDKQGYKGVTLYMKTCSIMMQQAFGNHKEHSLTPFGSRASRTRKGVPRILPVLWRRNIFTNFILAQYVLSIFAIYRFLLYDSKVKVDTITAPFDGNQKELAKLSRFIPEFFNIMKIYTGDIARLRQSYVPKLQVDNTFENNPMGYFESPTGKDFTFTILTKSPTTYKSPNLPSLWSSHELSFIRTMMMMVKSRNKKTHSAVMDVMEYFNFPFAPFAELCGQMALKWDHLLSKERLNTPLGKLGLKQEAAGKMRVFAMVDPVTQWAMYPIHRFIFDFILDKIPMDGTFNQLRPLNASLKWSQMYSLDLSAATDRLPLSLQKDIVNFIFPGLGESWGIALTDRFYSVPGASPVQYAVGQPMGAYSSWSLLALTNHFLVQFSARKAGVVGKGIPFVDYAILGDDVVIGHKKVATSYLEVLAICGVKCGLHKSLLSPNGLALEFAKRTWYKGKDISPITIRDLSASLLTIPSFIAYANNHSISLPRLLKIAGFGYKVLGGLNKPFRKLNRIVRDIIISSLTLDVDSSDSFVFGRTHIHSMQLTPEMENNIQSLLCRLLQKLIIDISKLKSEKYFETFENSDITSPSVMIHYFDSIESLTLKATSLLSACFYDQNRPLENLRSYLDLLREKGTIEGMVTINPVTALYGVEPYKVKLFKQYHQVIKVLTSNNKIEVVTPLPCDPFSQSEAITDNNSQENNKE